MSQNSQYEEEKPFLDEDQLSEPSSHHVITHHRRDRNLIIALVTTTVISWLITIYLLLSRGQQQHSSQTPSIPQTNNTAIMTTNSQPITTQSYYPTDLESMRSSIIYEPRTFTGELYYNTTTKLFIRNTTSSTIQYVGPPSDAIDAAWEDLLHDEWTPFTLNETTPYLPRLKTFNGQYRFEPDMFHSLHCLNEIRKRIDIDYYTTEKPEHLHFKIDQEDWDRIHIDHCLDQIRQAVMCFGDLSPVPLYSWEGAPLGIGQGSVHTCRKWEPIREWVDARHKEFDE